MLSRLEIPNRIESDVAGEDGTEGAACVRQTLRKEDTSAFRCAELMVLLVDTWMRVRTGNGTHS